MLSRLRTRYSARLGRVMSDPIELKCGDTATVRLTFATGGVATDLSGCRVSWTVRTAGTLGSTTDTDAVVAKVSTSGDASGVVEFALSTSDTRQRPGSYVWDAQLVDTGGSVTSTQTGTLVFLQDVTKDVA